MTAGWVAAAVRARGMVRTAGVYPGLEDRSVGLARLEHGISAELLWRIRILAAWVPRSGLPLARAVAARFELSNIEGHLRRLRGLEAPPAYRLGTLATAWRQIGATESLAEFHAVLSRSPWGDPGSLDADVVHDAMFSTWLTMPARAAPETEVWCARVAALSAARLVLVQDAGREPAAVIVQRAAPFLGRTWPRARTVPEFVDAVPSAVRPVFDGVTGPDDLWRAEALARKEIEAEGRRLLHASRPGPRTVLGALALMTIGAWRANAALAVEAGAGSEVLDVVG